MDPEKPCTRPDAHYSHPWIEHTLTSGGFAGTVFRCLGKSDSQNDSA